MHLAACFQTNQHVREAPSPFSTCGKQTAPDCGGATRIQMHMFTFPSICTQQLSLMQEEEKKKRPLVLKVKENGYANKGAFVEERSWPGQAGLMPARLS